VKNAAIENVRAGCEDEPFGLVMRNAVDELNYVRIFLILNSLKEIAAEEVVEQEYLL
jgi:hypothetical protein